MKRTDIVLAIVAAILVAAMPLVTQAQSGSAAGAIEGAVFLDTNGNGAYDVEEAGVIGVTVRLTGTGADRSATSDSGGLYRFADLADGTYTVTVDPESPYTAVDRTEYENLEVAGDTLTSVDFALEKSGAAMAVSQADASATATKRASATTRATATKKPTATTESTESTATTALTVTSAPTMIAESTATTAPTVTSAPTVIAEATAVTMTTAEQMPQTGFEDWGSSTLLAAALAVLVAVAAAGWMMERRG